MKKMTDNIGHKFCLPGTLQNVRIQTIQFKQLFFETIPQCINGCTQWKWYTRSIIMYMGT